MPEGCVKWPEEYRKKYLEAGCWLQKPLGDIVDDAAEKYGSRPAIAFNGKHITYDELKRIVDRLALHLLDLGHKPLDRMILQTPNVPETIYLYFAAVKIGVIPIMTLPPHRMAEIGYFAGFAEVTSYAIPGVFRNFDYTALAEEVRSKTPSLKHILVTEESVPRGMISLPQLLRDPIEERVDGRALLKKARPDPFEPALFQLSGGTTGIPKLIPRTHNDYYYNSLMCKTWSGFNESTAYMIGIPITHNFAVACPGFQGVFLSGGKVVIAPSPAPDVILSLMEQEKITQLAAVPAMVIGWMSYPELKKYDISSLEQLQVGGSKLNAEVAREIGPKLGADVQQILGMAEGPLYFTARDESNDVKFNTQGRPISPFDEFKIMDPSTGIAVPKGERGELWCRGPYTIRGYYKAQEHNAKAFTQDGFYKSGDMVRLHPSGNLIVEGRLKDTINRGGEKISAEEVENHILAFPKIMNCAYVAMPDPVLDEKPCVFVVPAAGQTFDLKELNEFLLKERQIARYKLPERLEILNELPLTNVGKINKVRLREMIAQILKEKG